MFGYVSSCCGWKYIFLLTTILIRCFSGQYINFLFFPNLFIACLPTYEGILTPELSFHVYVIILCRIVTIFITFTLVSRWVINWQ